MWLILWDHLAVFVCVCPCVQVLVRTGLAYKYELGTCVRLCLLCLCLSLKREMNCFLLLPSKYRCVTQTGPGQNLGFVLWIIWSFGSFLSWGFVCKPKIHKKNLNFGNFWRMFLYSESSILSKTHMHSARVKTSKDTSSHTVRIIHCAQ